MSDLATDHGGPPNRGPAVFAVTTATLVLASVFVAARMISRIAIVHRVTWDDYAIFLAWLLALGLSLTIDLGTVVGLGKHREDIAEEDMAPLKEREYVFSVLYNPALMATKTSILIFYLRLSKNTQNVLRYASWAVLAIVNIAGTILTLINIFQCRPVEASFNIYNGSAKCIPLLTEFICSAPVNVVTDLAILALPIPVLTSMRLPQRQKTILVITFAMGVFVTIVDVVRIYYLQQAITNVSTSTTTANANTIYGDSPNFAWNASLALMWSAVEVNIGIACACVPTLKPLIIRILPAMLVDPDGTGTKSNQREKHNSGSSPRRPSQDVTSAVGRPGGVVQPPPASHPRLGGDDSAMSMMEFLTTPDWVKPNTNGLQTRFPDEPSVAPDVNTNSVDFLTTPDMSSNQSTPPRGTEGSATAGPSLQLTLESTRTTSIQENSVYFGFVNMKKPKSMLKTSVKESWKYCSLVTVLFFLWGFSYGLLNTLNNAVAAVSNMSTAMTLGLTSAYFGGGYLLGPLLVGEWILRHDEHHRSKRRRKEEKPEESVGGFKATFMLGLCIYGIGTIMFWPSAVLYSFPGFMVSNFVVGFGLAVLETAANPFLALCGPSQYSEMRLLLAQGVQGVGSVTSGVLAQDVFFDELSKRGYRSSMTLLDVQWTYLAITLLCVVLALFFYYMPLPEVRDGELEKLANRLAVDTRKTSVGGFRLQNMALFLAVFAQWTYVAAQESMSVYFRSLLTTLLPYHEDSGSSANATASDAPDYLPGLQLSIPNYLLIAHTGFALSRFFTGFIAYLSVKLPENRFIPQPRTVLGICTVGCIVAAILVVSVTPTSDPNLMVIPVVLFFLFEGPIWPLIFALGLRGQGKRTKRAGAYMVMGASGPMFWPFVMYGIIDNGGTVQIAYVVVAGLLAATALYPLYLTFCTDARLMTNPLSTALLPEGRNGSRSAEDGVAGGVELDDVVANRRRRRTRSFATSNNVDQGGLFGLVKRTLAAARQKKQISNASGSSSTQPVADHENTRSTPSKTSPRETPPLSDRR